MPKLANDQAAALIQKIIDEYIGTKSWFYQQQIAPYLPELSAHMLNEFTKNGVMLAVPEPPKAKAK